MMNNHAWEEGFKDGQAFAKQCPYRPDTRDERDWHAAWLEGASKALGLRYSRTQCERTARHSTGVLSPSGRPLVRGGQTHAGGTVA